jgi:hypothetical protein
MAGALKKLAWILENVDSLERCSGLPGLYLEEHTVSIIEMIKWWDAEKSGKKLSTHTYFKTFKKIIDSGYLDEFVMDEYSMLLITPKNLKLDFEDYNEWKVTNLEDFNLNRIYYFVEYTE